MNTYSLKIFLDVAKTGSFTQAASNFYTTQPAISRRIGELEEELGFKLFYRRNHGVELTEEGKEMVPVVTKALEILDTGVDQIKNEHSTKVETIRLAAILPAVPFLPFVIGEYEKEHPDINIEVFRQYPKQIQEGISNNRYDIYICGGTDFSNPENMEISVLRKDYFGLITRKGTKIKSIEEAAKYVKNHRIYAIPAEYSPVTTGIEHRLVEKIAGRPLALTELFPIESIMFNIAAGKGCAIMPDNISPFELNGLEFFPVSSEHFMSLSIACHKFASEPTKEFVRFLTKRCEELYN